MCLVSLYHVQRSEEYFAESINSDIGFYGFQCESYFQYVFGWCNMKQRNRSKLRTKRVKMGEHCEQKYAKYSMDAFQDLLLMSMIFQSRRNCVCKYEQKSAICHGMIEIGT